MFHTGPCPSLQAPFSSWRVLCSCAATCGSAEPVPSACPRMRSRCATAGLRWRSPLCSLAPAQQALLLSARPSARVSSRWQPTWLAAGSSGLTAPLQQPSRLCRCLCRRSPAAGLLSLGQQLAPFRSLTWPRTWPQWHLTRMGRSCLRMSSCCLISSCWAVLNQQALQGRQLPCLSRAPLQHKPADSQWRLLRQSRRLPLP